MSMRGLPYFIRLSSALPVVLLALSTPSTHAWAQYKGQDPSPEKMTQACLVNSFDALANDSINSSKQRLDAVKKYSPSYIRFERAFYALAIDKFIEQKKRISKIIQESPSKFKGLTALEWGPFVYESNMKNMSPAEASRYIHTSNSDLPKEINKLVQNPAIFKRYRTARESAYKKGRDAGIIQGSPIPLNLVIVNCFKDIKRSYQRSLQLLAQSEGRATAAPQRQPESSPPPKSTTNSRTQLKYKTSPPLPRDNGVKQGGVGEKPAEQTDKKANNNDRGSRNYFVPITPKKPDNASNKPQSSRSGRSLYIAPQ